MPRMPHQDGCSQVLENSLFEFSAERRQQEQHQRTTGASSSLPAPWRHSRIMAT